MAEKTTLSAEQQARVNELVGDLDRPPEEVFFPLKAQFDEDMSSLDADADSAGEPEPTDDMDLSTLSAPIPLEADDGDTGGIDEIPPQRFSDEPEPGELDSLASGADSLDLADLGDLGGATEEPDTAQDSTEDQTDFGSLDFIDTEQAEGPAAEATDSGFSDMPAAETPGGEATGFDFDSIPDVPESESADLSDFGDTAPGDASFDAAAGFDTTTGMGATEDSAAHEDVFGSLDTLAGGGDDLSSSHMDLADLGLDTGTTGVPEPSEPDSLGDLGDFGATPGMATSDTEPAADLGTDFGGDFGSDLGTDLGGGFGSDLAGGFGSEPENLSQGGLDTGMGLDTDTGLDFGTAATGSGGEVAHPDFDFGGEHLDIGGDMGLAHMDTLPDLSGHDAADLGGPHDMGSDLGLDTADLAAMSQESMMSHGIGDEFSDEELARLRTQLLDYSPGVRKAVIDAIVNEKISAADQRLLTHMIIDQASDDALASFIESRLGYRPDTALPDRTRDGVPILYTEDVTPEALRRRRRRAMLTLAGVGGVFAIVLAVIGGWMLYNHFSITGKYERGLAALRDAEKAGGEDRLRLKQEADAAYQDALNSSGGKYDVDYMTRFGIGYMKAGFYDDAFHRLFGKVDPPYDWTGNDMRAPLVRLADGSRWFSPAEQAQNYRTRFVAMDQQVREVLEPGAYLVARLRDSKMNRENLLALGRFHSGIAWSFIHSDDGKKYKNDMLAIDYYRLILTLLDRPHDLDALAGIGKVYYNRAEYGTAVREYSRILEHSPAEIRGHAGLLETYIAIWLENGDPRFVIDKHREIQRLGLEKKLPIFTLSKLAGFYIDIKRDDLRIRYQVDPVDNYSGLDLDDNAIKLLDMIFEAKEERDGETIRGSSYAEGYYQRGRYLTKHREAQRSVKQFQNAFQSNPRHYPSVNEIGEYYAEILDFDRAREYFLKALETREQFFHTYGTHPEDETLARYDMGRIYYNLASLVFVRYAGIQNKELPKTTRIYPESETTDETADVDERRRHLYEAAEYLQKGLDEGLNDEKARRNALFWLGWVPYIQGDFGEAIRRWSELELEDDESSSLSTLAFGKANAAFHTKQYRTALGYYLKLREDLERLIPPEAVGAPSDEKQKHTYFMLYSVYNNLGAVYEAEYLEKREHGAAYRDLERLQTKGLAEYMKAIELARTSSFIPEKAMLNQQFAFKPGVDRTPLIEDWLNPTTEE